MIDNEQSLPKFCNPPLIEVVHGVQFSALAMTIVHPGLFYERIRGKYPVALTQPPLPPIREVLDERMPPQFSFNLMGPAILPRAWFASEDGTYLVQLQSDRLLLNWRRGEKPVSYPHFEQVSTEFQRLYEELESFVADQKLGTLQSDQCEMTYINHLDSGLEIGDPGEFVKAWNGRQIGFAEPVEDCGLNMRFLMRNKEKLPVGRLAINMATLRTLDRKKVLQLDLTARGIPAGTGLSGIIDFHKMAHSEIVRYFVDITTLEAQSKWERSA